MRHKNKHHNHHNHPIQSKHGHFERGLLHHLAEHFSEHAEGFTSTNQLPMQHAIGRHGSTAGGRGRHGFGGFGTGGGGGGFDERDGFNRGRKFSSQDLQLLLMALLADKPAHGYELIKALELRTNGFYTPSPGMIYPALTYLEELGYVTVELNGNRKCYSLSDTGTAYLVEHQERVTAMLDKITHIARKMDLLRRAYAGSDSDSTGSTEEQQTWLPELMAARHAIKSALSNADNATKAQQQQVTEILRSATTQISAIFNKSNK